MRRERSTATSSGSRSRAEDVGDRIVFRCGGGTQLVVTHSTVGTKDTQTQRPGASPICRPPS
jgi:hypothetical protein